MSAMGADISSRKVMMINTVQIVVKVLNQPLGDVSLVQ